jgi:hypothetical protein
LATLTASVLGGWWWLRNLAVYGAVQPRGLIGPPLASSPARRFTLADKGFGWTRVAVRSLSNRFWVEHSVTKICSGPPLRARCDANTQAQWIPAWTAVATVVTLALVAAAVAFAVRRRAGVLPLVAVLLPFVFALAQLLAVDWLEYSHSGALSGLQGRYFFLAAVGLAALVALGAGEITAGRAHRWLPLAVLCGAAALHARTIVTVLGYHWNGAQDGLRAAATGATAWSALPAIVVRCTWLGAVALTLVVGLVVAFRDTESADISG